MLRASILCLFMATCFAEKLISTDEIDSLFKRIVFKENTEQDTKTLYELLELIPEQDLMNGKSDLQPYKNTLECVICRSAFAALFDGVNAGRTEEELTDSITVLCVMLGIENINVCRGAIGLNIPILSHIIKTTPEATPAAFCGLVLQNNNDQDNCPINDNRFEWTVELPQITDPVPSQTSEDLKIVVITDAHLDPLYQPGAVADCDEPTCCRPGQTPKQSKKKTNKIDVTLYQNNMIERDGKTFVELDSVEKIREAKAVESKVVRNSAGAGYWGDYRNCDTPIWAYDNAVEEISRNHRNVDLIYYIGDSIDHFVWTTTYELITQMNEHVVQKLRDEFGDNVPVIATIGNHESQPTNQFAPTSVVGEKINTTWLYDNLAEKWGFYLTDAARESLLERGDFSIDVKPGLKVISLNNNIAYKYNWWLVFDPLDAKRHLDWLVEELYAAEQAGQKVHILTHIPPGVSDLTYTWTREYNRIVNRFASTIAAEFNGHTHSDEFKVFYNDEGAPISVAWGAGSTTAYSFYNLNYKIVEVNGTTYELENMNNFVYNLTEANLTPNKDPHWFELYDFKHRFGLQDLSAVSIGNLVERMVTTDVALLDLYNAFYSKLSDRWSWCNDDCKIDNLCKTVVTVLWEREKCEELRSYYFSTKK